jgi:uncharacterized membrane protein YfcA
MIQIQIQYLIVLIVGFLSGFVTGSTGIAATGLVLAAMSLTQIIPDYRVVMGTILYVFMFPFTAGSSYEFYKKGFINFTIGNILILGIVCGSLLGTNFILHKYKLSVAHIKLITGIISLTISITFLREYLIDSSGNNKYETF